MVSDLESIKYKSYILNIIIIIASVSNFQFF